MRELMISMLDTKSNEKVSSEKRSCGKQQPG